MGPNHGAPVDREVMANEERLLLLAQIDGASLGVLKKKIFDRPVTDLLELEQQRRGKVERGMHERELLKEKGHVEVGLGRMKTDPGHARRSRDGIGVVGLVHVPKKADANRFHRQVESMLRTYREYVIGIPTMQSTEQNGKVLRRDE